MRCATGRHTHCMKDWRKDRRHNGRWLWVCVTVGKGRHLYIHSNGIKRVTFAFLPRKADAPHGSPRGVRSLRKVIQSRIKPKSFLIFDGWKQSKTATEQLGFRHAPPVIHDKGFRDRDAGFHSNDVESENARIKQWLRMRYSKLPAQPADNTVHTDAISSEYHVLSEHESLDMYEYCFYCNVGAAMPSVMEGLSGGLCRVRHTALP